MITIPFTELFEIPFDNVIFVNTKRSRGKKNEIKKINRFAAECVWNSCCRLKNLLHRKLFTFLIIFTTCINSNISKCRNIYTRRMVSALESSGSFITQMPSYSECSLRIYHWSIEMMQFLLKKRRSKVLLKSERIVDSTCRFAFPVNSLEVWSNKFSVFICEA